jgi:drug/metabolite transporter (DMT)-like permease
MLNETMAINTIIGAIVIIISIFLANQRKQIGG